MIRIFLLLTALLLLTHARENPFFPAKGMLDMPVTASNVKTHEPLKRAALTLPDSARVLKEVTVKFQNLDGTIATRSITLDHKVDWHLPLFVSQSYEATKPAEEKTPAAAPAKKRFKKLAAFEEASFWQSGKTMKIKTSDKLIRHFIMINPHRIVLDFKRDADFRSKSKTIEGTPFKSIRLGNHKGYYRAVVELDGQYRYTLTPEGSEILISLY